jgi:hypothetical protein
MEMVKEAEGRTIQPLISAGKTDVPPGYAAAMRTPVTWDERSDEALKALVGERGRKWKLISGMLGDFTDMECKSRWMFLTNVKRLR